MQAVQHYRPETVSPAVLAQLSPAQSYALQQSSTEAMGLTAPMSAIPSATPESAMTELFSQLLSVANNVIEKLGFCSCSHTAQQSASMGSIASLGSNRQSGGGFQEVLGSLGGLFGLGESGDTKTDSADSANAQSNGFDLEDGVQIASSLLKLIF